MYLRKVTIENVRSIKHFEMTFPEGKEAGWHVIIGDNGAGKTTALRVVVSTLFDSLAYIGRLKDNLSESKQYALPVELFDLFGRLKEGDSPAARYSRIEIGDKTGVAHTYRSHQLSESDGIFVEMAHSGDTPNNEESRKRIFDQGIFIAFGPYRQITPYGSKWEEILAGKPKVKRVINLFYDDATFYETGVWLKELNDRRLREEEVFGKNHAPSSKVLDYIKSFINHPDLDLLPHGTRYNRFDVETGELLLTDGNGKEVLLKEMSSGYRSVLALVFEIIRHMIDQFGAEAVFKDNQDYIDCEGVVLIDEIDAHLHPTWQTRIGQWFTKYFPNLQFIVTTHSPLICRACEKGSIWRLAAPGSEIPSGEITGIDRDRLIYGNILDAYGTEVFGEDVTQSEAGQEKARRLAELSLKSFKGFISAQENDEFFDLREQMPTVPPVPAP